MSRILSFANKGCLVLLLFLLMLSVSCTKSEDDIRHVIGVAQANLSDPWREVMNAEILAAASEYAEVRVVFSNAGGSSVKQKADIERMIRLGVDLLIVSPVDSRSISPVIQDVYANLPVIVLDKAIEGYDYSLFIGVDNDLVGQLAGRHIKRLSLGRPIQVIEVTGDLNALPVVERMEGLRNALKDAPEIEIIGSFSAGWQRDLAEDLTEEHRSLFEQSDVVFAHNDAMAYGVHRALERYGVKNKPIIGIDGISGPQGGLELVFEGILEATITCPTGGEEAVLRAMDILEHQSGLPKKIILRSSLVTQETLASQSSPIPALRKDSPITLGFAHPGRESAWRLANIKSIGDAAKDEGIRLIEVNANNSQEAQIAAIRSFIDAGVDVIGFSPIVATGWDEVLREARDAGIPVICSDRTVEVSDENLVTTYLVSDFWEEGRRAAQWLKDETAQEDQVKIVEIAGLPGSTPAIDRAAGFAEVVDQSPHLTLIDSTPGDFIENLGYEAMVRLLIRHSQIDAVFAHNDDMALGAIRAIEEAGLNPGKDILLVSIDGVREAFLAMRRGKLNCTVECSPLLGPPLMKAVKDFVAGEELPLRINPEEGVFPMEVARELIGTRPY